MPVYMKKIILIASVILLLIPNLQAQDGKVTKHRYKPELQHRFVHFGYTIGLNTTDFSIRNSDSFYSSSIDTVYSIEAVQTPGFFIGGISNFHLGRYFDLRILFNLTFAQRNLIYQITNRNEDGTTSFETKEMKISSTFTEFPILLKYKSQRINNYRFYLISGLNFKLDLAAKRKIPEIEMPKIRLNQPDLYFEFGLGMDLYTKFFKFSPEIKFGSGFMNVLANDNTEFSGAIGYLKSQVFMLSFHFE